MGIASAFMSLLAISNMAWRQAFLWLFLCLAIDGIDGTFARLAKVDQVLPRIDGKMIDTVVDYVTYAFLPAYIFYQAELAPAGWNLPCALVMVVVAALYYGKEGMVSESMHFVGFPVLWNVLVFYLFFVFDQPAAANAALIGLFAVLHFVPLKFAYPSRSSRFQLPNLVLGMIGLIAGFFIVWNYPQENLGLEIAVGFAGVYFMGLAVWESFSG